MSCIAGRLKFFADAWSTVTDDKFILRSIAGYEIKFISEPLQDLNCHYNTNANEAVLLKDAIRKLLERGAVRKVLKRQDQFVSPYFLVPKSNGEMRFVLNLKKPNKFIQTEDFKLENFRSATKLVSKNCFMGSIDLKDAYFLIPLHKNSQKYMCFDWEGERYSFVCLPFGLNIAPWLYTKITRPIVNWLRRKNLLSVVYLDDWICFGNTYEEYQYNLSTTIELLELLGFIINNEKSNTIPQNRCRFLGFILNSPTMTIELPEAKGRQILDLLVKIRSAKSCSIREFASLVGCIVAACPAIEYGWMYTKSLKRVKYLNLLRNNSNYSAPMKVPNSLHPELDWWQENILTSHNMIRQYNFQLEIFSDASRTGWGAACNGEITFGFWSQDELEFHINYLELKAALNGMIHFADNSFDCELLLRIDNTTAVSYVNRMGGIQYPKPNDITRKIWQFCEQRKLWMFASYIASKENVEADTASRALNVDTEWEVASWAYRKIIHKFGDIEIDLFASKYNKKSDTYCSWQPDGEAFCIDAFTLNWSQFKFFAFPPVP